MVRFIGFTTGLVAWSALISVIGVTGTANADFAFGEPINLGPRINSPSVEGTPVLPADGLSLYFDSSRSGGSGDYDVWVATRETIDSEWSVPVSLGSPVNSPTWDGVPSISPDGLTLFLCSYRAGGSGESDIWMTSRETTEDNWATPVNLGPLVNSPSDDWTQSISGDGLELYFSSWRPGGMGNSDLWITRRAAIEEEWSTPVNLGPGVNSSSDDVNPSISTDGLCLFFFSLRAGGYGNRDIWVTTRVSRNHEWRTPVNVGPPVNTASMDQGASFSPDGTALFFCSSRPGGYGSLDLMQVPLVPVVDFNGDGKADGEEVLMMADHWGQREPGCDIGPSPFGDGIVDVRDLKVLAEYIGEEVYDPTLVAYWALDEMEGDIAYDEVSAREGMLTGDPVWEPDGGIVEGALGLDGVDDCLETGFVLDPADGAFSVLAWIKGGNPRQTIVSQIDGANWLTINAPQGTLATALVPPARRVAVPPLVSDVVVADNVWHRVAFVWDGASRSLHVDGMLVSTDEQGSLAESRGGLYIGCGANQSPESFFTGLIDDVRIYRRMVQP